MPKKTEHVNADKQRSQTNKNVLNIQSIQETITKKNIFQKSECIEPRARERQDKQNKKGKSVKGGRIKPNAKLDESIN